MALQTYTPVLGNAGFLFPDNLIKSMDVKLREQTVVSEGRTLVRQTRKVGGERYEATVRTIPLKRGSAEFQAAIGAMGAIRGRSQRFYLPMPRTSDSDTVAVGDYVSVADLANSQGVFQRQVLAASCSPILVAGTFTNSSGTLLADATNLNAELAPNELGYFPHTSHDGSAVPQLNGVPVLKANGPEITFAVSNATESNAASTISRFTVSGSDAYADLPTFASVPEGTRYIYSFEMRMEPGDANGVVGLSDINGDTCTGTLVSSYQRYTAVVTASSQGLKPRIDLSAIPVGAAVRVRDVTIAPVLYVDRSAQNFTNWSGFYSHSGMSAQAYGYENNMLVSMNSDVHEIGFADSGFVEFEFDVIERL